MDDETPGGQWAQVAHGWSCRHASPYRARHYIPQPSRGGTEVRARKPQRGGLLKVHHNPIGSTCLTQHLVPTRRERAVQANLSVPSLPVTGGHLAKGGPSTTSSTCGNTASPSTARPPHSYQARQPHQIPSLGHPGGLLKDHHNGCSSDGVSRVASHPRRTGSRKGGVAPHQRALVDIHGRAISTTPRGKHTGLGGPTECWGTVQPTPLSGGGSAEHNLCL